MARVGVEYPAEFASDSLASAIENAALQSFREELEIVVGSIKADPAFPTDVGALKRDLRAVAPVRQGGNIVGWIVADGASGAYSDVMDRGRTPGRRDPPIAKIAAWVRRKMPGRVREIAQELQQADAQAHKRRNTTIRGAKTSRAIGKYDARALFLLARAVQRKIGIAGIVGRRFVDGKRPMIEERIRGRVQQSVHQAVSKVFA